MTRPLSIKYNSQTGAFQGLQEMSDAELSNTFNSLGLAVASKPSASGNLTVNINGIGTVIGGFTDTSRPDPVNSHPVGTTILESSYVFNQILQSETGSPTRPVEWSNNAIRQMSDASINEYIFDKFVAALSGKSTGSYVLQPNEPTGGTWVQLYTITNSIQGAGDTTYLWRKTNASPPSSKRPLKISDNLREMTDNEIATLFDDYANYVIDTGKGKYAVSDGPPAGGTWVKMGETLSDTIRNLGNVSYTGYFTRTYSGGYYQPYSFDYTGYFTRTYYLNYTGSYTGSYNRAVATSTPIYYSGRLAGYTPGVGYTPIDKTYSGSYNTTTTGQVAGPTRTVSGSYFVPTSSQGSVSRSYTGLTVLSSTATVSNINLWIRTG